MRDGPGSDAGLAGGCDGATCDTLGASGDCRVICQGHRNLQAEPWRFPAGSGRTTADYGRHHLLTTHQSALPSLLRYHQGADRMFEDQALPDSRT